MWREGNGPWYVLQSSRGVQGVEKQWPPGPGYMGHKDEKATTWWAARKAGSSRQVSVDEEMEELLGQGSRSALLLWQELCWPTAFSASFHPLSSGEKK